MFCIINYFTGTGAKDNKKKSEPEMKLRNFDEIKRLTKLNVQSKTFMKTTQRRRKGVFGITSAACFFILLSWGRSWRTIPPKSETQNRNTLASFLPLFRRVLHGSVFVTSLIFRTRRARQLPGLVLARLIWQDLRKFYWDWSGREPLLLAQVVINFKIGVG